MHALHDLLVISGVDPSYQKLQQVQREPGDERYRNNLPEEVTVQVGNVEDGVKEDDRVEIDEERQDLSDEHDAMEAIQLFKNINFYQENKGLRCKHSGTR